MKTHEVWGYSPKESIEIDLSKTQTHIVCPKLKTHEVCPLERGVAGGA